MNTKGYLIGYYVNKKVILDSVAGGSFISMSLSDTLPKGFYNMMLYTDVKDGKGKFQRFAFDVINTGENMDFNVSMTDDKNQPRVEAKGGENFIYNEYFKGKISFEKKISALQTALDQYPEQDEVFQEIVKQVRKLEQAQIAFVNSYINKKDNSIAGKYIDVLQRDNRSGSRDIGVQDPLMKYSPFIPLLVWDQLNVISNDSSLASDEKQKSLIKRIDVLMAKLMKDRDVYKLILIELVKTFEKTGMNEVVVHLNEKYLLPDYKENALLNEKIKEKTVALKGILVGQPAPDIRISDDGDLQRLYDIKAKYTVLLFWESNCENCQKLTQELLSFYHDNKDKDIEVIAMAMDTSQNAWLEYIISNNFDWINYSDFKGWDSKAAKDYNVVATPSMFLLDKEKKIIGKPVSIDQLKASLI
jgi:peroxiredoxin